MKAKLIYIVGAPDVGKASISRPLVMGLRAGGADVQTLDDVRPTAETGRMICREAERFDYVIVTCNDGVSLLLVAPSPFQLINIERGQQQ